MRNSAIAKFKIMTLGCKINIFESESISSILMKHGYLPVQTIDDADIIIINTCTVTNRADSKSKNNIRRARKNNPNAVIVVCGCLVNTDEALLQSFGEVDILLKNQDKDKIIDAINTFTDFHSNRPFLYEGNSNGAFNFFPKVLQRHSRAFLKIQDGCNNNCSYCKIPQARGTERSRSIDDVILNIKLFEQSGYKEIIFSGINLGNYNYQGEKLSGLINKLINIFPDMRFRISSVEPQYIDDDFLNLIKNKNICPHFHIPLQNGSNAILQKMSRRYTTKYYEEIIKKLRGAKNNPFISTDIIIGFPGETQDDFEETVALIKRVEFSFMHLFRYSARNNTKAATLKNSVPQSEIKKRMDYLIDLNAENSYAYAKRFINKKVEVIIESKKENYFIGRSGNYLTILIPTKLELQQKKKYSVIINKMENNKIYGELI